MNWNGPNKTNRGCNGRGSLEAAGLPSPGVHLGHLGVSAWVWFLAGLILAAGSVFAAGPTECLDTIDITTLPYTVVLSDTCYCLTESRHSNTGALSFNSAVTNVSVFGDGTDTAFMNEAGAHNEIGINFNNADHITLKGLIFRQNSPAAQLEDTANLSFAGFNVPANTFDVLVEDCDMYVAGRNAQIWYASGSYNMDVRRLRMENASHAFDCRINWALHASFVVDDLDYNNQAGFLYHYRIDSCTVIAAPWVNFYFEGTLADVWLDSTQLFVDAYNSMPDTGSCQGTVTFGTAEQCYAVGIRHGNVASPANSMRAKVTNCGMTTGTAHAGGDFIFVSGGGIDTTEADGIWIYNNTYTGGKGDAGEFSTSTVAKFRDRANNVVFRKNVLRTTGGTADNEYSYFAELIRIENLTAVAQPKILVDSNIGASLFRDLTETGDLASDGVACPTCPTGGVAMQIDPSCDGTNIKIRDNFWTAGTAIYQFGQNYNGMYVANLLIDRDSVALSDSGTTSQWTTWGWAEGADDNSGNVLRDCRFDTLSGAAPDDITLNGAGDVAVRKSMRIHVEGYNGIPVSGAQVYIENAYGQVLVDSAVTDYTGEIDTAVNLFRIGNDFDSSAFNDFIVAAIVPPDTTIDILTWNWYSGEVDTIVLTETFGGLTLTSPATISSGWTGTGPLFGGPRYKVGIYENRFVAIPVADSDDPPYVYSIDGGATWDWPSGDLYDQDLHLAAFFQSGVGIHIANPGAVPNTDDLMYGFIADPCSTAVNITAQDVVEVGTFRATVGARADTVWVVGRHSGDFLDTLEVYWSIDQFATDTSHVEIVRPAQDHRIHLAADSSGLLHLWIHEDNGAVTGNIKQFAWNGTTFGGNADSTVRVNSQITTNQRTMAIVWADAWHYIHGIGGYLVEYRWNGSAWIVDTVSSGTPQNLAWYPSATAQGNRVYLCYNTTNTASACHLVMKVFDGTAWSDSVPVTGADDVDQYGAMPERLHDTIQTFPLLWVTDGNDLRYSLVTITDSGSAPAAAETISTPTTPSGPSTGLVDSTLTYSTTASSSDGHTLEYRFVYETGDTSSWSASASAGHSWAVAGEYTVYAQARCATHTDIVSTWSSGRSVSVSALALLPRIKGWFAP